MPSGNGGLLSEKDYLARLSKLPAYFSHFLKCIYTLQFPQVALYADFCRQGLRTLQEPRAPNGPASLSGLFGWSFGGAASGDAVHLASALESQSALLSPFSTGMPSRTGRSSEALSLGRGWGADRSGEDTKRSAREFPGQTSVQQKTAMSGWDILVGLVWAAVGSLAMLWGCKAFRSIRQESRW
ncbi:hypothetical protein BKA70DRAFT_1237969 [Coprinopsis sp. MPI-PUGE-AT-0042]|nr:hypothetical protein BKA70DRAFT_1237969 [Coprinopsis sp. MPI-PUGE-AT-0042]